MMLHNTKISNVKREKNKLIWHYQDFYGYLEEQYNFTSLFPFR